MSNSIVPKSLESSILVILSQTKYEDGCVSPDLTCFYHRSKNTITESGGLSILVTAKGIIAQTQPTKSQACCRFRPCQERQSSQPANLNHVHYTQFLLVHTKLLSLCKENNNLENSHLQSPKQSLASPAFCQILKPNQPINLGSNGRPSPLCVCVSAFYSKSLLHCTY